MKKIHAASVLTTLFLVGCLSTENVEVPAVPDMGVPSSSLNQDLEITSRPSANEFKIGENIVLDVHLKTDLQVNANFEIQIFLLDEPNQTWIEVPNFDREISTIKFLETEDVVLDKYHRNIAVFVRPILDDRDKDATLLIILKAKVLNGDKANDLTASYAIVTLRP